MTSAPSPTDERVPLSPLLRVELAQLNAKQRKWLEPPHPAALRWDLQARVTACRHHAPQKQQGRRLHCVARQASVAADACARRCLTYSMTAGMIESRTMAMIARLKLFFTMGRLPKK